MASRAIHPARRQVSCPVCSKILLLKNWKEHSRAKHYMIFSEEDIKKEYENLKQAILSSSTSAMSNNTRSSMKHFSSTQHSPVDSTFNENGLLSDADDDNSMSSRTVQHLYSNLAESVYSSTDGRTSSSTQSETFNVEMIDYESDNQPIRLLTPTPIKVLQNTDHDLQCLPQQTTEQHHDDICSDTTSDSESENNDNITECSSPIPNHLKSNTSQTVHIPVLTTKVIPGVIFISSKELSFVEKQRSAHPHVKWYPESTCQHKKKNNELYQKPCRLWFTPERPWLRAICSDERYGLLCMDCSEFGYMTTKVARNRGAFVVRPFWKSKHQVVKAICEHESSEFHRLASERRLFLKNIQDRVEIIEQFNYNHMQQQTNKYLPILVQTFWYIVTEEMTLNKFESLIELIDRIQVLGIREWMYLPTNKQKYWGHEAVSEWLLSIHNYLYQQQLASIRKTDFMTLIIDEIQDISINKMISICLRYVEKDTGRIREQLFKIEYMKNISDDEEVFILIEQCLNQLEKDAGKRLLITGQTYDGSSNVRYQTSSQVRSRLSAWAFYIYCRSDLFDLAVKDSGQNHFNESFDTLKSALTFIHHSPQRLEILFNNQRLNDATNKGQTISKALKMTWNYNYEILHFSVQHYLSIIQTLTTIAQLKVDGSSDARRYAFVLLKPETVFEIILLKNIFQISLQFLREIESHASCLDNFSSHAQVATASISETVRDFDFQSFKSLMNKLQLYTSTIITSTGTFWGDFDENKLRDDGEQLVAAILTSLSHKFDKQASELVENLTLLSIPSKLTPDQLLRNDLIRTYTHDILYEHTNVVKKTFRRMDRPLLNINRLRDDVHTFLVLTKDLNSIQSILQYLAIHGQEQVSEWYKLYQLLGTFAIGLNEAEHSFSTLRRLKSWQRNPINDLTLKICLKASTLTPCLTDEGIQFIIDDFLSHPGRAKSQNITILDNNDEEQYDND